MKNKLIEALLKTTSIDLIINILHEDLTEEELISLWNLQFPSKIISSPTVINEALAHLSLTEALKELCDNFDVDAKYCYYNGNYWVTFNDVYDVCESCLDFKALAEDVKRQYKEYLEDMCENNIDKVRII